MIAIQVSRLSCEPFPANENAVTFLPHLRVKVHSMPSMLSAICDEADASTSSAYVGRRRQLWDACGSWLKRAQHSKPAGRRALHSHLAALCAEAIRTHTLEILASPGGGRLAGISLFPSPSGSSRLAPAPQRSTREAGSGLRDRSGRPAGACLGSSGTRGSWLCGRDSGGDELADVHAGDFECVA
jgi:hypothetical protein